MYKKITIFLIIFLISCKSTKKDSKGNFNDLVILSSIEDRMVLEEIINNNIFLDTFFTPEPEPFLNKLPVIVLMYKIEVNNQAGFLSKVCNFALISVT